MKTFKPMLWNKAKSNGSRHIKIYISENRKKDYFPLKIFVHADKISNNYMNWIDGRVANATHINIKIKEALDRFQHLDLKHPNISIKEIKELYCQKEDSSFYDWYQKEFELRKEKVRSGTAKSYGQLTECLKTFAPDLQFEQINYEFVSRFESYLNTKGLAKTTIYRRMKTLKMYVKEAFRQEKIRKNPFDNYKLRDGKSNRIFLDKKSLDKIVKCKTLTKYEKEARTKFLFQCYTGLSYSDMISLKWSEIRDNSIIRARLKTDSPLIIPLIPEAMNILKGLKRRDEYVFSKISNQKYNEFLHAIEARLELPIPLTSHVARHTFATVALESGVSIAVVSSILGHTNIRTTQIYAKITKKLREEEMKKVNFSNTPINTHLGGGG